jgi:hypothetical protein
MSSSKYKLQINSPLKLNIYIYLLLDFESNLSNVSLNSDKVKLHHIKGIKLYSVVAKSIEYFLEVGDKPKASKKFLLLFIFFSIIILKETLFSNSKKGVYLA